MQSSIDITSYASPFENFLQYVPRDHEKALRNSFFQVLALLVVAVILIAAYFVVIILEPFFSPLFWAVLTGFVLHPYKKFFTTKLRQSLETLEKNETTMILAWGQVLLEKVDQLAEGIGTYVTRKWKTILLVALVAPATYFVYNYTPGAFFAFLVIIREILMDDLALFLNSVSIQHVIASGAISFGSVFIGAPTVPSLVCQTVSLVAWIILAAYLMNFLWTPLVYLVVAILIYGYVTEPVSEDVPDGEEPRLKGLVMDLLSKFNLIRYSSDTDAPDSPAKSQPERPASDNVAPTCSTPKIKTSLEKVKEGLESGDTPKIFEGSAVGVNQQPGVIQHPGVSALKKEHGVPLIQNRHNISEIPKLNSTPLNTNTPRTRDSRLGRSYRRQRYSGRRKSSLSARPNDSTWYIKYCLWGCGVVQIWLHPRLLHLFPVPISYYLLKQFAIQIGAYDFVKDKFNELYQVISDWLTDNYDLFMPLPVRFLFRVSWNVERKILSAIIIYSDSIVTGLMVLAMILGFVMAGCFISVQVYSESVHVANSVANIASTLNINDSYILTKLNHTMSNSGYDVENVMDGAYQYGRNWISSTLQKALTDADPRAKEELETKVLELWDRSYQFWVVKCFDCEKQGSHGPAISRGALTTTVGEIFDKMTQTPQLFNLSNMQDFVTNNMGTLTSILDQLWILFKGNVGFLLETCVGMTKVLLYSGSGVINFVFGIIIYLTAVFYLLSNSTAIYIPLDLVCQYSIFYGNGVGPSLQKAINSVFLITIKMASFYSLWTYLTHTVFQSSIVVLPLLTSSFIAAVPVTGQWAVALPSSLELWLLQDRPLAAFLLVFMQVAPSWLVDPAIYSEIKGGLHPWLTGLAIVGGIYVFGVGGAIYGPLILCGLYVLVTVYTTFLQETSGAETPPGMPPGSHRQGLISSMRTPFLRSETMN